MNDKIETIAQDTVTVAPEPSWAERVQAAWRAERAAADAAPDPPPECYSPARHGIIFAG